MVEKSLGQLIATARGRFSITRVATLLGISFLTVKKLIKDGELQSIKIGNREYVMEESLRDYLEGRAGDGGRGTKDES